MSKMWKWVQGLQTTEHKKNTENKQSNTCLAQNKPDFQMGKWGNNSWASALLNTGSESESHICVGSKW